MRLVVRWAVFAVIALAAYKVISGVITLSSVQKESVSRVINDVKDAGKIRVGSHEKSGSVPGMID